MRKLNFCIPLVEDQIDTFERAFALSGFSSKTEFVRYLINDFLERKKA